jgi:hypothetical protein
VESSFLASTHFRGSPFRFLTPYCLKDIKDVASLK